MMVLVRLIDVGMEYVKLLLGLNGGSARRVLAWISLLSLVCAGIALIAWGVWAIPMLVDTLNGH